MTPIFEEFTKSYLIAKKESFANNETANLFRHKLPQQVNQLINSNSRYKIAGSVGKGNWADCPWIAILDLLITDSPQSGYYPVFLFQADMKGFYLSLNQGVTEIRNYYKHNTKEVLSVRATDFRAKVSTDNSLLKKIELNSKTENAKLYEAGNIFAKYYSSSELPDNKTLSNDILYFLNLYDELINNDQNINENDELTAYESKKRKLHYRVERNRYISLKVKKRKGYTCEVCDFNFTTKYGALGKDFIETHHLIPISTLELGKFKVNLADDFAVLCSNCHRMIHRLQDTSNIKALRAIVKNNRK